jgi:hypothetical protein
MKSYAGPTGPRKGDEWPEGAGKYNADKLGHEAFNFFPDFGGALYGTFGIMTKRINLRKIDPALPRNAESVDGVLVIFIAPYKGGQRIVGWYRDAIVHREVASYPREVEDRILEHLISVGIKRDRTFKRYRLEAKRATAVLLPMSIRMGLPPIPRGTGGMGEFNVCYILNKSSPWIQEALGFIRNYRGPNLLNAEAEAEAESFDAQERAAGFQSNPKIRAAVEKYSMDKAKQELIRMGFSDIDNTSQRECYDYTCSRGGPDRYYVEVKGTQGSGKSVILTKNEVAHWRKHKQHSIAVIVRDIKVDPKSFRASRGTSHVCRPWSIESAALEPSQYTWTVSGGRDLPGGAT